MLFSPIAQLFTSPLNFFMLVLGIIISLSIHEAAHAWSAYRLGDNTAQKQGRLTLDPSAHIDIFGAVVFLIAGFGWGKPVPVHTNNFENPRRDYAITSFAGPASNYILAFCSMLIFSLVSGEYALLDFFLQYMIWINLFLGTFNLLPFPPLDGGNVLMGILPNKVVYPVAKFMEQHGMVIFYTALAVNLVFHIPIITGPIGFISNHIADLFSLAIGFFVSSS